MNLKYEKVAVSDDAAIKEMSEFSGEVFVDYYKPQLPEGQAEYMREKFLNAATIKEKISHGIVFEFVRDATTGENMGFLSYYIRKDERSDTSDVDEFYLDKYYLKKEARGKGLGRLLMEHLKEVAKAGGFSHITLNVNKYNKTVEIYKKLGFETIRAEVNDIGNGFVMDDYVMRLVLE